MILDLAFLGIVALAMLAAFTLAVGLVRRYPPAGIGLAALVIIPLWEVPHPPPLITLAGLSVTSIDVITLILFVVGLLEFPQLRANLQGWSILWLFLGLLIVISLLRGAATFGLGSATNESRGLVWFYFAMTWALSVRPELLRLHKVSLVLGWALAVVAFYHGVRYGFGGPTTRVSFGVDGSDRPGRVLIAGQAAALLLCAGSLFLRTSGAGKGQPRFVGSSLVFLGVVLLSQHRSVWTAGLVGLAAVLISARAGRAHGRALVLLAIGAWLVITGLTLWGANSGFFVSALNSDTLEWRTSSWQALISDAIARGPSSVLTGEPFGSGFLRTIGAAGVTGVTGVQAHNWYVEIFLRLGIIGLGLIAWILTAAVVKSRARSTEWTFILVAVGVFASAYAVDWFLAPWLAAAMVVSLRGCDLADESPGSARSEHPSGSRVGASTVAGGKRPTRFAGFVR